LIAGQNEIGSLVDLVVSNGPCCSERAFNVFKKRSVVRGIAGQGGRLQPATAGLQM